MQASHKFTCIGLMLILWLICACTWGLLAPQPARGQAGDTALEPAADLAKRTRTPTPTPTPTFIATAPPPGPTDTPLPTATAPVAVTPTPLPGSTSSPTATTTAPVAVTPTPLPGSTSSPTATVTEPVAVTPTPQPVIQTLTLAVLDGWDELFADRLSQLDQVGVVASSDDDSWEVAANSSTSFEFENALPTGAIIQTVKLFIEHSEDEGLVAANLYWEVGQGDLQKPTVLYSQNPALLTLNTEAAVEWDITSWINTPAQLQSLKLLIRNSDPSVSTWIDHLYLVVTYSGDVTSPPTATPLPAAVNLQGQVQLEGRPPLPNAQWALPLSVNLRTTDAKGVSSTRGFALLTDNDGAFQMNDLPVGAYQIAVKGLHTLQRVVQVKLQTGDNPIHFGLLREGDAVNDNRVNILDFSRLASAFGRCATSTNYLASADFDQDGCIALPDVDLLVQNFGELGEVLGAPQLVEAASAWAAMPIGTITNKRAGDRFTILLTASNVGNQPLDAAALYLNFDPAQLEVVNLAGSALLPVPLLQQVDNPQGQLDYAAGILGEGVTGSPPLLAITFTARRDFQSSALILESAGLRQSTFAYRGQAVTAGSSTGGGAAVTMQEVVYSQSLFLPVIRVQP